MIKLKEKQMKNNNNNVIPLIPNLKPKAETTYEESPTEKAMRLARNDRALSALVNAGLIAYYPDTDSYGPTYTGAKKVLDICKAAFQREMLVQHLYAPDFTQAFSSFMSKLFALGTPDTEPVGILVNNYLGRDML
jgi:hypothetical protein